MAINNFWQHLCRRLPKNKLMDMNHEEINAEHVNDENTISNDGHQEKIEIVEEEIPQVEEDPLKVAQDKYVRLYSDFDNFRKRTQKEKADLINYAAGDVLKDFLGVFDDFQRALEANKSNDDVDSLKEGFELLYHKLDALMKNKGLQEMDCIGEPFNPDLHEAITNVPAGEEMKGKVVDVIQKGYILKERVIRYAKVVVGQ